ncbi:Hypothetical predicted protein [Scomber scombrus]|uniref:Uncharacterized protein n=1 Tax=Scomber scombrus TaxID=13677 RepID=A0AAV1PDR5_SCOSC
MESTAWLSLKYLHPAGPEVRSVLTDDDDLTTCGQRVRAGINKQLNHFKDQTCEMHDPSLEEEKKKKKDFERVCNIKDDWDALDLQSGQRCHGKLSWQPKDAVHVSSASSATTTLFFLFMLTDLRTENLEAAGCVASSAK